MEYREEVDFGSNYGAKIFTEELKKIVKREIIKMENGDVKYPCYVIYDGSSTFAYGRCDIIINGQSGDTTNIIRNVKVTGGIVPYSGYYYVTAINGSMSNLVLDTSTYWNTNEFPVTGYVSSSISSLWFYANVMLVDTTSGAITIQLPNAIGYNGKTFLFKRISGGGNNVTISPQAGYTIDGATSYSLTTQFQKVKLIAYNGYWFILNT